MFKFKKSTLILVTTILILALLLPINSFATGTINVIAPGSATPSTSLTPTPSTQATPSQAPNVTATPSTKPNLPQTGIGDYTGLIIAVVVLGGSAIFAYKKIKQYNKF